MLIPTPAILQDDAIRMWDGVDTTPSNIAYYTASNNFNIITGTLNTWVYIPSIASANDIGYIFNTNPDGLELSTNGVYVSLDKSNKKVVAKQLGDASTNGSPFAQSSNNVFNLDEWFNLHVIWDTSRVKILINNVSVADVTVGSVSDSSPPTSIYIGRRPGLSTRIPFSMYNFWLSTEKIYVADNFINNNDPAILGTNGQLPTGNTPNLFFKNEWRKWFNNKGSFNDSSKFIANENRITRSPNKPS